VWGVTDSPQGNFVQTRATATQQPIYNWYKKGATGTQYYVNGSGGTGSGGGPPSHSLQQSAIAPKYFPMRTIRATGAIFGTDWNAWQPTVRALTGCINDDDWGPGTNGGAGGSGLPTPDPRGYWLFLGPTTTTNDHGKSYFLQLDFLYDPYGHFALLGYVDRTSGDHPDDCDSEATLRTYDFPVEGGLSLMNGVGLASIYPEGDFSTFTF
jgi:hypothetical protein